MPLPLIGVGVTAAASFILRKGVAKAAKRFTPSLLKKAKEFIKNKWNSLNKKGKALVCAVAIIIAVLVIQGA